MAFYNLKKLIEVSKLIIIYLKVLVQVKDYFWVVFKINAISYLLHYCYFFIFIGGIVFILFNFTHFIIIYNQF